MESQLDRLFKPCFARIRGADRHIVGAGFLVTRRHVLTCAHVVADALKLEENAVEKPQDPIILDFAFLPDQPDCKAVVEHWYPRIETDSGPRDDIAVLLLEKDPPSNAHPARLVSSLLRGFRAHGFPAGLDAGVWTEGKNLGSITTGWLQIEGIKEAGIAIKRGFSGGPVQDLETGNIVGMVAASTKDREEKVGFAIPIALLRKRWHGLPVPDTESPRAPKAESQKQTFSAIEFVGRGKEQQLFEEFLNRDDLRLLTICDRGAQGKTHLLRMFEYKCKAEYYPPKAVSLILLDEFEYTGHTLVERIREDLYNFEDTTGLEVPFSSFDTLQDDRSQHRQTPGASPSHQSTSDWRYPEGDRTNRKELSSFGQTRNFFEAFFEDLKTISDQQHLIILLDSWDSEKVSENLQTFITNRIVQQLCIQNGRPKKFSLVLAGKKLPHVVGADDKELLAIEPLSPFEEFDIEKFLQFKGYENPTKKEIESICNIVNEPNWSLQDIDMLLQNKRLSRAG